MTPLVRKALASLPLTPLEVEKLYANVAPFRASLMIPADVFRRLCESHERLRMELQGAEELLKEAET